MEQSKRERRQAAERQLGNMRHAYLVHGNERHGGTVVPSACTDCQEHLKGMLELRADAKAQGINLR